MSIYLHIPFCKQACHYCNFHFSTSLKYKDDMVKALLAELEMQKNYLGGAPLETIYLGGGTPSLLSIRDLDLIFNQINRLFTVLPDPEITLEANPDDLDDDYLNDLRAHTPVNRLSIGVQSFFEADLKWMNRAHDRRQAIRCIESALKRDFTNLTIDLIYGAPTTTDAQWEENLHIAFQYPIHHLSSYCLTVEEGTALHHFVRKGKSQPVDEARAAHQFEVLMARTAAAGFEQYEISNFARPGHYARHNSSYWRGTPYLGVGPSAHSFSGHSRQWNISNNALYMKAIGEGKVPFEIEHLTVVQRYNEYVMTMLRTVWGCKLDEIRGLGADFATYFEAEAQRFIADGVMEIPEPGRYRLTPAGRFLADGIAAALFADEN